MDDGPAIRRLSELRKARWNHPQCRYFITCCVTGRQPVLTGMTADFITREIASLSTEGVISESAHMIMPDHIHWLFRLGDRLELGQVVARLKAKTKAPLMRCNASWQSNYFEHRLRTDEFSESYALYMFLNPYRASIIPVGAKWPHWSHPPDASWEFLNFLDGNGAPPAHWSRFVGKPGVG